MNQEWNGLTFWCDNPKKYTVAMVYWDISGSPKGNLDHILPSNLHDLVFWEVSPKYFQTNSERNLQATRVRFNYSRTEFTR